MALVLTLLKMYVAKRSSAVTAQHEIHERSCEEVAARATQHHLISPHPAKLLLRSLCCGCAFWRLYDDQSASAAILQFMIGGTTVLPLCSWRFSLVSVALTLPRIRPPKTLLNHQQKP